MYFQDPPFVSKYFVGLLMYHGTSGSVQVYLHNINNSNETILLNNTFAVHIKINVDCNWKLFIDTV